MTRARGASHAWCPLDPGGPEGRLEDARPQRAGMKVWVPVDTLTLARPVLAKAAPLGPVGGDGVAAVLTPAPAQPVGGRGAVPVPPPGVVGFGPAEGRRIGLHRRLGAWYTSPGGTHALLTEIGRLWLARCVVEGGWSVARRNGSRSRNHTAARYRQHGWPSASQNDGVCACDPRQEPPGSACCQFFMVRQPNGGPLTRRFDGVTLRAMISG